MFICRGLANSIENNDILYSIGQETFHIMSLHRFVFYLINIFMFKFYLRHDIQLLGAYTTYKPAENWPIFIILGIGVPTFGVRLFRKIGHKLIKLRSPFSLQDAPV